jgi:transcriptional regulator with XRE-family HTH domain
MALDVEQKELAQESGVDVCHINRILRGRRETVGIDTRRKLALGLRRLTTAENIL